MTFRQKAVKSREAWKHSGKSRLSSGGNLTDSMMQALQYLRNNGLETTDNEERYAALQTVMYKPRLRPLYPV